MINSGAPSQFDGNADFAPAGYIPCCPQRPIALAPPGVAAAPTASPLPPAVPALGPGSASLSPFPLSILFVGEGPAGAALSAAAAALFRLACADAPVEPRSSGRLVPDSAEAPLLAGSSTSHPHFEATPLAMWGCLCGVSSHSAVTCQLCLDGHLMVRPRLSLQASRHLPPNRSHRLLKPF